MRASIFRLASAGLLALGAGCNLFNPSGEGSVGSGAGANLAEGEALFQRQDYAGAMAAYDRAIRGDSASALAYYGYAKAALRFYQVNANVILGELAGISNDSSLPFLNHDEVRLTRYLQAGSKVRRALNTLTDRDTLTRWWTYLQDSSAGARDPRRAQRIAFMRDYLQKGDRGESGYRKPSQFPLLDRTLPFEKIAVDLGFLELLYSVARLRDLDRNDTIDQRDDLLRKLNFNIKDGLKVENLDSIVKDLNSPENRQNLNNLVLNVAEGLGSASNIINLLAPIAGDSLSNGALSGQVSQNVDSVIKSLGSAVTFYQFGDRKDNDGDGCIDEEILDGKDNDGDGFTDEDARIAPVDTVDNNRAGGVDDPSELPGLDFTLGYAADPGFVKGEKYRDSPFRVRVQADSLAARYPNLGTAQRALLDSAKALIGGCWRNYP